MAMIEIEIASRRYSLACRDGEEANLRAAAALVDARARDAAKAMGPMSEARQLLFAALMLADSVQESNSRPPASASPIDEVLASALERLASRVESLATRVEEAGPST